MFSRRSFLTIATATVLTQLISGCSSNSVNVLKILLLKDSVPLQLINDFRKTVLQEKKANFQPNAQLQSIFNLLEKWQKPAESPPKKSFSLRIFNKSLDNSHLATLGDSWLSSAIQQKLIQPLEVNSLENWSKLPLNWQKLVRRDRQGKLAENGEIWGAPYRWGGVVIAYRQDKIKKIPRDWQDLWSSELRGRISLLDSPRETIGLTLKKLGYSYNTSDLTQVANLEAELSALHQQVKFYSSDHYLQPLILGDTWLAVGWSTDILPISKRYSNIKFVIPQSGTSLWTDLWVKPQLPGDNITKEQSALAQAWIDFCWQLKPAQQISLFTSGTSPILWSLDAHKLSKGLQKDAFITLATKSKENSEFLLPLEEETAKQYESLWLKIRQ